MAIFYTNNKGTFFSKVLLQHIKSGDNLTVMSILDKVKNPCELVESDGTTLLHHAALYGNKKFMQHLVGLANDVDILNHSNETPLMYAVVANHAEIVEILLDANADIFILDARGLCALGRAFGNREKISHKIVKALLNLVTCESLKKSKYVATEAFHRGCPLYNFMSMNNVEITKTLLEMGSQVNAKDPHLQETALHRAVAELNLDNVKLLLEHGADVNAQRYDGRWPIALIENFKDQSKVLPIVETLIDAGAMLIGRAELTMYLPSAFLAKHGNREVVRTVLKCDIDLQFKDTGGMTIMHYLAENEHPDILEELRGLNFDVNFRCNQGKSMLHYAVLRRNVMSVRLLIDDYGADVNARDSLNCTPLCTAINPMASYDIMRSETLQKSLDCVQLLLERGADCQIFSAENSMWTGLFQKPFYDTMMELIDPVLAHVAIVAASGQTIKKPMQKKIKSCPQFKSRFDSYKRQLEESKAINVDESMSLFEFLTVSEEKILLYSRYKRTIPDSDTIMKSCTFDTYFKNKLEKRLLKVTQLMKLRAKVTDALNKILEEFWNVSLHNITFRIVSMLEDQDLYEMS